MQTILRNLILTALFSMACLFAQVQVIPQIADGGGWSSVLVLTNTTATTQGVSLQFFLDTTKGNTETWIPFFLEGLPTSINAGSSVFLHTPGTRAITSQGWAQLIASPGVVAYVIYTFSTNGRDQDATAPAVSSASRILLPFDNTVPAGNTKPLVTALAVVNPNAEPLTIAANFRVSGGSVVQGTPLELPSNGQLAILLPTQFTGTAGQRGLAEFYSMSPSGATFSIIALRANPTGGFTSLETYNESGSPII
jgi:hypothetical protein